MASDRPASWRTPSSKQMEKMAASAAVGTNGRLSPTVGPAEQMPPEYWDAVLREPAPTKDRSAARSSPARCPRSAGTCFGSRATAAAASMTTILAAQSAEARAKGEVLIRTADRLL